MPVLTVAGYFKSEVEKESIPMRPQYEFSNMLAAPSASEIDELADRSESLEQRVASLNDSYETLRKREVELTEWRWVLTEAGGFFDRVVYIRFSYSSMSRNLTEILGARQCGRDSPIHRQ